MRDLKILACLVVAACAAASSTAERSSAELSATAVTQTISFCYKPIPRLTPAHCVSLGVVFSPSGGGSCSVAGSDFLLKFTPGSHKQPPYGACPSGGTFSACTNDFFRAPSSWDTTSGTSDYEALFYAGTVMSAGAGYVEIIDDSLKNQITTAQWNAITSIAYVDVSVAWSTADSQVISLEYSDAAIAETQAGQLSGNYPNGTLSTFHVTNRPGTTGPWGKADLAGYRDWLVENGNAIDATHRGVFVQSITEQVGFYISGAGCP
jgi:hypothetical protein